MTASEDQFEVFNQDYATWQSRTQALPLRRNRDAPKGAFELDLDHLIDYVRPVLDAAAKHSTQFDYPKVASEYLNDLDQIKAELQDASLADLDRQTYLEYLAGCRQLLADLGSLPVPPEGHLGFRGSALQAFRFLVDKYGFEVTETSPTSVGFRTNALFVNLSHSPECPMNSLLVGRRTRDETPSSGFILDDFAYVAGLGVVFDYDRFGLLDSAGIANFLQRAASLVHEHGGPVLSGDPKAFDEFQRKADERERAYIEMMERQHSAR